LLWQGDAQLFKLFGCEAGGRTDACKLNILLLYTGWVLAQRDPDLVEVSAFEEAKEDRDDASQEDGDAQEEGQEEVNGTCQLGPHGGEEGATQKHVDEALARHARQDGHKPVHSIMSMGHKRHACAQGSINNGQEHAEEEEVRHLQCINPLQCQYLFNAADNSPHSYAEGSKEPHVAPRVDK